MRKFPIARATDRISSLIDESWTKFVDDFFNPSMLSGFKNQLKNNNYPRIDAFSKDEYYYIQASVPGILAGDLKIETFEDPSDPDLRNKNLTKYVKISGKAAEDVSKIAEDGEFNVKELRRSYFERVVKLPEEVLDEPEALLKNGLLTLKWKTGKKPSEPATKLIPLTVEN